MRFALGISEDSFDELLSELSMQDIYQYLTDYGGKMLSLYYYADRIGGSFLKPRYKTDLIANKIFDTLSAQEQMKIYEYFDWLKNNPE